MSTPKKPPKEDAEILAVFKEWVASPTNPYRLQQLAEAMVVWDIKARMKNLPEVTQ
jgi:hypothetical protein